MSKGAGLFVTTDNIPTSRTYTTSGIWVRLPYRLHFKSIGGCMPDNLPMVHIIGFYIMNKVNFSRKANAGDSPVMKFSIDGGETWFNATGIAINDIVPHLTNGQYRIIGNYITSGSCVTSSSGPNSSIEVTFGGKIFPDAMEAKPFGDEIKRRVRTIVEAMEEKFPAIDETAEIDGGFDLHKEQLINQLMEKYLPGLEYEVSKVDRVPIDWHKPELWPNCEQVDEFPCCINEDRGYIYMIGDKGVYQLSESHVCRVDHAQFQNLWAKYLKQPFFIVRCSAFEIINKFY